MYKDNGTVDVEFLADVGYIANRIRSLDDKLTTLAPNPLDANTAQIFCNHPNATALTVTNSQSCSSNPNQSSNCSGSGIGSSGSSNVKASEKVITEFYERHQNYHRNRERAAVEKQFREKSPSKLYHLTNGGDTMNNTNRGGSHIDTISESPADIAESSETEPQNVEPIKAAHDDDVTTAQQPQFKRQQTGRGSFSQPMPEIQISTSEDTDQRKNSVELLQSREPLSPGSPLSSDGGGTGSCGHYCGGWQSSICTEQLSDEDLRQLVLELKQRVEFTERMNWLLNVSGLSKRPAGPPHRKTSLPKHTEVKKRFLEICDRTLSKEIISALRLPAFDSYEWEDEDVLHLMQTMFLDLGLVEKFDIPLPTLREWLYEVYKHYNAVPFHNFRHCFCVAQMMYAIACQVNLAARLGDLEVLILLVSCICHDLDHPGYNNIYQINARTELALRYNDISPLENHHCSIAFRLLEHPDCNIFKNFNKEIFKEIREGIIRCILATDMARHNEILTQFQEVTPIFDYSNENHINLLCMILIKVADISNEARPMDIAEPWLERLLQEFFAQSAAEKSEGLPVTPFMDPDKVSKPGSQVRFIGLVLLPLFEALGDLIPELVDFIIQPVRDALDYYKKLNDAQNKSRRSLADMEGSSDGGTSPQMPRSQSGISVRSRRSIPSQKSASRNSVDEPLCISGELQDLPEGSESGDSETATEVEVAEKTSKFKVDTESGNRNKANSNTRKGSREKRPSMISEMHTTGVSGRMRGSYGSIHNSRLNFGANRAVSLDQYSTGNRRSSDGLQQVTSDHNVYYNQRQQRSVDNDPISENTVNQTISENDSAPPSTDAVSSEIDVNSDNLNKNVCVEESKQTKCNPVKAANTQSTNGTKTFMSRLRQLTGRFSFSFDKDPKRTFISTAPSINNTARNNNSNEPSGMPRSGGFCCSNKNPSPLHNAKGDYVVVATTAGGCCVGTNCTSASAVTTTASIRSRAYSLDVPVRTRYSSSNSGGGDSRKSSKNDDNNHIMLLMMEDNNSNQTNTIDNKSDVMDGVESNAGSFGGGVGGGGADNST